MLALALMACGGKQAKAETAEANNAEITAVSGETLTTDGVAEKWGETPITVKDGGSSPDVMTLLKAFHSVLPTNMTAEVLLRGEKLKDGEQYESEDDYRVLVDRKKGYCDLESETADEQMQACVWQKMNGHRIFAVTLYDECESSPLICWYDYDPKTQVMSSAEGPVDKFRPNLPDGSFNWELPINGTDFVIMEFPFNSSRIDHVYKWDGEKFTEGPSRIREVEYLYFGSENVPQDMPTYRYYTLLDLTGHGCLVLWLSDGIGANANSAMFASNKEGMQCIADIRGGLRDTDYFSVTELPPLPGSETPDSPTLLLSSRDEAGGYNMTLVNGEDPVAFLFDQPDVMGGGRIVNAHNCYGDDDVIMQFYENSEGKDTSLPKPQWKPFVFVAEF